MWNVFREPKKQLLIISIIIVLYWSWELFYIDLSEYRELIPTQLEMVETPPPISEERSSEGKSTTVDTVLTFDESLEEHFPDRSRPHVKEDSTTVVTMELRLQFWDMILGHLASIITSLVALLTPLITVFLNHKGYFKNPSKNDED